MKLVTQGLFMWVFAVAIMLLWHTAGVNPDQSLNFYNSTNSTSVSYLGINGTTPNLMDTLTNPQGFLTGSFWTLLLAFIAGTLGIVLIAGLLKITSTDAVTFTPMFIMYLTFAAFPIGLIFQFLNSEIGSYSGGAGTLIAVLIPLLICGTLAFNWVTSCMKMWRTGFVD